MSGWWLWVDEWIAPFEAKDAQVMRFCEDARDLALAQGVSDYKWRNDQRAFIGCDEEDALYGLRSDVARLEAVVRRQAD